MVGEVAAAGVLRSLMNRRQDVRAFKDRLLQPTFGQGTVAWGAISGKMTIEISRNYGPPAHSSAVARSLFPGLPQMASLPASELTPPGGAKDSGLGFYTCCGETRRSLTATTIARATLANSGAKPWRYFPSRSASRTRASSWMNPKTSSPRRVRSDEIPVFVTGGLASDEIQVGEFDVLSQFLDLGCGGQAAGGGFDDDQHGVDGVGGGPAQVFDAGVHVQQHQLIPPEQDVGDQNCAAQRSQGRCSRRRRARPRPVPAADAAVEAENRSGRSSTRGLSLKYPPVVPGSAPVRS